MVLAMYDFDINDVTSVKKTILAKADKSGINEEAADEAHELDVTNKIDDDTWKLIAYFDKYGLDMTNYTIGGYDDLRYSTLVALFNASHIITWTPVTQYHQGPDGLPTYDKNGKAIDETNTDGMTYQVPVMVYDTRLVSYKDGTTTRIRTYIKKLMQMETLCLKLNIKHVQDIKRQVLRLLHYILTVCLISRDGMIKHLRS